MAATLVLYLPLVLAVHAAGDRLLARGAPAALAVLWLVFTAFMAIRALFFWRRIRGDRWAVVGATR
jgi:Na+-driven multidrug efflux pump